LPRIDIAALAADTRTGYPSPYDRVVVGRQRKRLGNAVGLDQFGVNLGSVTASSTNRVAMRFF
jgi:uncharacterized cupin superfamily protein